MKNILVVIDPTAQSQPALERAGALAKRLGARITLFIADYDALFEESRLLEPGALNAARDSLLDGHTKRLRALAEPLEKQGLAVGVDARWDHPLHEAIVRKAVEIRAELVVKDTHYHSVLKRSIFSNTDWNLIRNCPGLLLLVKPRAIDKEPCFIAAVDPLHEHDKPADLDRRIIAAARALCTPLAGELHVFHAFDVAPLLAASTDSMMMPIAMPIQELTEALRNEHTEAVHALTDAEGIPRGHVHVHQGGTRSLLLALTEELRADCVVMGAVSRSGLDRLFVGSTAEDTLDKLGCDLLIVKPAGFTAPKD